MKRNPMKRKIKPKRKFKTSPERKFILTGKIPEGLNPTRAKRLGTRFLSRVWYKAAMERKGTLPTFSQRVRGGRLPKADLVPIETQIKFAMNVLTGNLSGRERTKVEEMVRRYITGRNLSISTALRETTRGENLSKMRSIGRELFTFIRSEGKMHEALMQDTTGKTYFAKGWSRNRRFHSTPLHEVVHILQKLGIIRFDVPFAQAADRLYSLENGFISLDPRLNNFARNEFDRRPSVEKTNTIIDLNGRQATQTQFAEPQWSYTAGNKLGQWVFRNLQPQQRWKYLYLRCMGTVHQEALRKCGKRAA